MRSPLIKRAEYSPRQRATLFHCDGRSRTPQDASIKICVRDLPGRMNHRAPRAGDGSLHRDPKVVFADRHEVRLVADGVFARFFGCVQIRVNSLHGQAILELGDRVVLEGVAEDGTIEAIRIAGASAFALGVQWHAEVDARTNPANRALFPGFWSRVT